MSGEKARLPGVSGDTGDFREWLLQEEPMSHKQGADALGHTHTQPRTVSPLLQLLGGNGTVYAAAWEASRDALTTVNESMVSATDPQMRWFPSAKQLCRISRMRKGNGGLVHSPGSQKVHQASAEDA